MKVLTAEQMSYVDKTTIESGIHGIDLMRNAGSAVYEIIAEIIENDKDAKIVIFAGKGNNGGDGFRVAELLTLNGFDSSVFIVGRKSDTRGDAAICMNNALAAGQEIVEIISADALEGVAKEMVSADVVVDALFGTGLSGEITGHTASIIDIINDSDSAVIAVDIPSGVNSTTGEISKHTVQADYTLTFGFLKVGHVCMPGKLFCDHVNVVNVGFSQDVMNDIEPYAYTLNSKDAAELLPLRPYNAHKGTTGRILVIAGSAGLTGAAALTSRAAMRVGAGVVTVGCPASLNDILEVKLTEVMTLPLSEVKKKRCLSLRALGMIRESVRKVDVVAVGPGLGTYFETTDLVKRFISSYSGRVVLDADGINAFKDGLGILRNAPCEIVLTPHPGELSNLMGESIEKINADPFEAVKKASIDAGKIIVLKGTPTIIANPQGKIWINNTGNEGMATAGMGDVLTGTIAGLAAQGLDMYSAAILGTYVHGLAGELASAEKGIPGIISSDVLEKLPVALLKIMNNNTSNTKKESLWQGQK